MAGKIAYIPSRFPKISETFVLREINILQEKGWDIELYPLILHKEAVIHAEAKPWLKKLHYFPWISSEIIRANIRAFLRSPFGYIKLWARMVIGNLSNPKFLVRALMIFPKAHRMAEEMQKSGVRHIHAHFATHPTLAAWLIYNIVGISYSVTAHAHDLYVKQTMLAEKMKSASFIITISEFNRKFLKEHIGSEIEKKINVVRCGIDPDKYTNQNSLRMNGKFQVKSIGSLQDYKGMNYLIEACALLVRRGVPLHCEIIGEGEERSMLEALISEYKVENNVILAGAKTQEEVITALAGSNCYVQPSIITNSGKMEGIPVSIMEALGSGLPVVASNISGISELVRPNETGYLVPEKDPAMLADAIECIYQHPQDAMIYAKKGQALVAKEYDLNINSACVADLFEKFLKSRDVLIMEDECYGN